MALIAEGISLGEMMKRQGLSTLIFDTLKEWQDEEIVDTLGDQIWKEVDEEWAEYMYGEGNSPEL